MSAFPAEWASAELQVLHGADGLVSDGDWVESKDQDPDGNVRLIQLMDVGDGRFLNKSRRFLTSGAAERLRCTFLEPGDVLVARMPDPLGRACVFPGVGQPAVTAVDVLIWRRGRNGPDARWVMHCINSPEIRARIKLEAGGTTRQRIAGGRLKKIELPVPPLAEQRRIVVKLDRLSVKRSAAEGHLARISKLAARAKQSILAAAFRGDLTAEWRSEHTAPAWKYMPAKEACAVVQSGGTPKADGFCATPGVPFLKVYNIVGQKVDFDYRPQFVTANSHESKLRKSQLKPGDVLMNIVGPPLGKVAIVPDTYEEWNCNQAITLFRPGPDISKEWIYHFLCSGHSVASVTGETRGVVGQVNISLSQCRNFVFPIPGREEQAEIVRRIEAAFARIDRLTEEASRASHLLACLDERLLAKAFRGELVPQDPTDEPASALLNRIRTERAAKPLPKRGRRKKIES